MRILVYGAGVLGCSLTKNLTHAKKDVTILARGDWATSIQENGIKIKNKFFLFPSTTRPHIITELKEDDIYDVIFVVMRYNQIPSILDILKANKSKNIIFIGNNVKTRSLAESLRDKNVMFGFLATSGYREKNKVVVLDLKKIIIGPLNHNNFDIKLIKEIFNKTKYKVVYELNMEDYLLCHVAFVIPLVFASYKTEGNLKKIKSDIKYQNKLIDANIEGYRAIKNAGHEIVPTSDSNFEDIKYRKNILRYIKLIFSTSLGKTILSNHAMNATEELMGLNEDIKHFFDMNNASYPTWLELEEEAKQNINRK